MEEAQVILMTYNRPAHTEQVLKGIRSEGITKFKIYIDKAISQDDREKQKELYSIFNNINWAEVEIEHRSQNQGLAVSIISAVSDTLRNKNAVIVLEDDCVPRPGFMKYMEFSLKEFSEQKKIRSICGYTYPGIVNPLLGNEIYLIERFCPWGWATWKDRWEDFNLNLIELIDNSDKIDRNLLVLGNDIVDYCSNEDILQNKADIWSLNWILCHFITNTVVAYPKISLIENIGFDGTGIHSEETNVFNNDKLLPPQSADYSRLNDNFEIKIDYEIQKKVIRFLEKHSKMSMVLNGK